MRVTLSRERGDNRLFITLVPKVFLFFNLTTLGLLILIGWLIKLSVPTVQPLIMIYKRDNFVCHHWGCTTIYEPSPYPFRSLIPGANLVIIHLKLEYCSEELFNILSACVNNDIIDLLLFNLSQYSSTIYKQG